MSGTRNSAEEAILALLRTEKIRPAELRAKMLNGEHPEDILSARHAHHLFEDELAEHGLIQEWRDAGLYVMTPFSDGYPNQLREVHDYPLVLFGAGYLADDSNSVAIVGSRAADHRALAFAETVALSLAEDNVTIVSGLAKGIDAVAHRAAIQAGGRTVAVLGNGVDITYPKEHSALHHAIADTGLVLSQFWPGTHPTKQSFPMRNAVMSAYAGATLIVTAQEFSGTKHQAKAASRHGRPLIITDEVVRSTTWGEDLANRGIATVASTPSQAVEAVRRALSGKHKSLASF